MRSLTLTEAYTASICEAGSSKKVATVTINPEDGTFLVTTEEILEDNVHLELLRLADGPPGRYRQEALASFSSPALAPFPWPSHKSQVIDVHLFPDDNSVTLLLAGGDIGTISLDGPDGLPGSVEVVGSVDSGIKAATWSPDEEQLILVTGEDMLVCMSRTFDLLHEEPLRQEGFGEDAFINVGWGSKSTQFHGSLGKAAAKQPASQGTSFVHPTDDHLPVITFRGDCAYFAVSSVDPHPSSSRGHRRIRIYSRDASAGFVPKLSATSEDLPGLEGAISWRPSGNLLAAPVRYGYEGGGHGKEGKWDVAMIERNGLRHGGFELRESRESWKEGKVGGMSWNADSEVLALWLERPEGDVVQLWTMKNYHYYLKQEIYPPGGGVGKRLKGIRWHPEQAITLYIWTEDTVHIRSFVWDTHVAQLPMPHDTATVAVIDGDRLLVTPFRSQNTPPPMSSYQIPLPSSAIHLAFSHSRDALAVLLADGRVQVWDLNTRLPGPKGSKLRGGGKVAEPKLRWETVMDLTRETPKQVCFGSDVEVGILVAMPAACEVLEIEDGKEVERKEVSVASERLIWSKATGFVAYDSSSPDAVGPVVQLAATCRHPQSISVAHNISAIFALSSNGKLYTASLRGEALPPSVVATGVTSFCLHPDFLIYTTSSHFSHYAPLSVLQRIALGDDVAGYDTTWESRRVERGSLLVTSCPSEMSLVMQMPRGNLETVYPRPLVLAIVRRDVLAGSYRSAFLTCRKHRLDLNVIHDLDPRQFMGNLEKFVEQIPEVDYLNLFVSSLSERDCSSTLYKDRHAGEPPSFPADKVNLICDALRLILERRNLVKYVETVLTAHVCKQPADYESGLRVLLQLQSDHPDLVEDAIKYIIFLSDVNQLYDVALGMYDFQLVLMIAQYSQKDPKEYLPFLRELKALDQHEQRFRIDDQLGRRESALRNLQEAGPSRWADASSYLARYELFDEAFRLYSADKERTMTLHDLYGDYLYDRREFLDAAISFSLGGQPAKALKAYEKAHAWRELFALTLREKVSAESLSGMCTRVSDHLASRGRHIEAAQVLIEYAKNIDGAVEILCRGFNFSEAFRLVALHDRPDLVDSLLLPGLEEAQEALMEVIEEMEGQMVKEIARIAELMRIRKDDPDTFYIVDNEPDLEGVDVATNATTAATNFTRYTVAPTTAFSQTTKMTGQTARTKHKPSKKRAAGRKGTVDEYDYLLRSLSRLVTRMAEKSEEAMSLLRHLVLAGDTHRDLGADLQSAVIAFHDKLARALNDAWKDRDVILSEAEGSGGMAFGGDASKAREAREVVKPEVQAWKGLGVLAR